MNSNKTPRWLPVAALFALSASPAMAAEADIAKGEEKSQVCVGCHGQQGISQQDNYPHLHGQQQTYLLRQMRTFRDGGDRRDPIMTPMLENMSDQDLINLAAYFSNFNSVLGAKTQVSQTAGMTMASPEISAEAKEKTKASSNDARPASTEAVTTPEKAPSEPASAVSDAAPAAAPAGNSEAGKTKSAVCGACHGMDGRGTTPLFPNLNGQKPEYISRQLKAFRDGTRQEPTMAPMAMPLSDQDIADLAAFYAGLK